MIKVTSRSQWTLTILTLIRERAKDRQSQILFSWQAPHWSLQGQYVITRQPNSTGTALAYVLCYKYAWTRRWPGSKSEKKYYVNGKQRENRHRLPRLGGKGVGIKPTTSSWKKYTNFHWVNILAKDGCHLLLPHIISSPSSDHKASFTYFIRERKKGK